MKGPSMINASLSAQNAFPSPARARPALTPGDYWILNGARHLRQTVHDGIENLATISLISQWATENLQRSHCHEWGIAKTMPFVDSQNYV